MCQQLLTVLRVYKNAIKRLKHYQNIIILQQLILLKLIDKKFNLLLIQAIIFHLLILILKQFNGKDLLQTQFILLLLPPSIIQHDQETFYVHNIVLAKEEGLILEAVDDDK